MLFVRKKLYNVERSQCIQLCIVSNNGVLLVSTYRIVIKYRTVNKDLKIPDQQKQNLIFLLLQIHLFEISYMYHSIGTVTDLVRSQIFRLFLQALCTPYKSPRRLA